MTTKRNPAGFALALILLVGGCGGGNTSPDLSGPPADLAPICAAGAKDCVTPSLARICAPDGKSWVPLQCKSSEACMAGDCVAKATMCTAADNDCIGNTAYRCLTDGSGFSMTACPAGTDCVGPGLCQGQCVIGTSYCLSASTMATCSADGKTLNTVLCNTPALEFCVDTAADPDSRAACKPSACAPDEDGCDFVCGDRTNPAADQTKSVSKCVATPDGYKWTPIGCATGQTCNPAGATCTGGTQARCTSECTPNQERCSQDLLGFQRCTAAGTWGAVTTCTATASGSVMACRTNPGNAFKTQCAVPLCAFGHPGTCNATGQFIPCRADGTLGPAAACASGSCVALAGPSPVLGLQPGACAAACQSGDKRCVGLGLQTCSAGGIWGPETACPGAGPQTCINFTGANGRPNAVCGECAPGVSRCATATGQNDGGLQPNGTSDENAIQVCGMNGLWPALGTACAGGLGCREVVTLPDPPLAVCVAECVPGSLVCSGNPRGSGSEFAVTCTSDGRLGPDPCVGVNLDMGAVDAGVHGCCAFTEACRKGVSGHSVGCVTCLAGNNEFGLPDTRCIIADGGVPAVQSCTRGATDRASNWGPTALLCPEDGTGAQIDCQEPSTFIPVPTRRDAYCHIKTHIAGAPGDYSTESGRRTMSSGASGCGEPITEVDPFGDPHTSQPAGNPISCPGPNGEAIDDCCEEFCGVDPDPWPAHCGPVPEIPRVAQDCSVTIGRTTNGTFLLGTLWLLALAAVTWRRFRRRD